MKRVELLKLKQTATRHEYKSGLGLSMADPENGRRLIFVCGAPRSGTTPVQNMLDSHPDICGGPEFLHLPDILRLRNILRNSIDREWIDLICSHEDVDTAMSSLVESLLLPLADRNGCKFYSEKSPQNIPVISELIKLFPRARFIHVVRDPRGIIASMLQVGSRARNKNLTLQNFTRSLHAAIDYVTKCFDAGFSAANNTADKVLTVCYENLVGEPESETKRICAFLHLDWSAQMLQPGNFTHLGEKAITVKSDKLWYDKETYQSNPNTRSILKWKTTLTPIQQAVIVSAFKDHQELSRLGYDFSLNGLPKTRRILYVSLGRLSRLSYKASRHTFSLVRRTLGKIF